MHKNHDVFSKKKNMFRGPRFVVPCVVRVTVNMSCLPLWNAGCFLEGGSKLTPFLVRRLHGSVMIDG